MNTNVLSAVREGTDLALELPCGVLMVVPGNVLQDWAETPATPEFLSACSAAMDSQDRTLRADAATPILEIIMQLLPTLLPICLPLITNSITKVPKSNQPDITPVVPK